MEALARKPFQGVINIIRFNWHFYAIAFALIFILAVGTIFLEETMQWIIPVVIVTTVASIALSLGVSYYVYDYSNIYSLDWLQAINVPRGASLVNIHAGFDETSHLLAQRYPECTLQVFDFYDPEKHTEVSIERARKLYISYPQTKKVDTAHMPLTENSEDYIFNIFAAHEIRNTTERVSFLKQLHAGIKPTGRVVIVEHLRDVPNFIAYNIGFFHFHSRAEWKRNFTDAGFTVELERSLTPFVALFILSKNDDTTH